jgi:predicted helicase
MTIPQYLTTLDQRCQAGDAIERSLLGNLRQLVQSLYSEASGQTPNLNQEVANRIAQGLGLHFTDEKEPMGNVCQANAPGLRAGFRDSFASIDLLDYLYAVIHGPTYRKKYREFLQTDFPDLPYPTDEERFWQLVELGSKLRQTHLLESPVVEQYITTYPELGTDIIGNPAFAHGRVWINDSQYFDGVPQAAWELCIGGSKPAQKWLKDRKGNHLSSDNIMYYQKIIAALTETVRLMEEIDGVGRA